MKNVITLFVIFAITISSNLLFAQNDWEVYTTSNSGLCSDSVFSIYTDNNNNLWFGTSEGISKFDGSVWTSYTSKNSPLQSGAFIYKILQYITIAILAVPRV